jgi:hypothetical protein
MMVELVSMDVALTHFAGHPKNLIGIHRAKKIAALRRELSQAKHQLEQLYEFQSAVLKESVAAAVATIQNRFDQVREGLVDEVIQTVMQ